MSKKKESLELNEERAVIFIPENAVKITLCCDIYHNGEIKTVSKTMDMKNIQAALKDAEENYFDPDARFVITDKGREHLNSIMERE